jgi:hypothetical protein
MLIGIGKQDLWNEEIVIGGLLEWIRESHVEANFLAGYGSVATGRTAVNERRRRCNAAGSCARFRGVDRVEDQLGDASGMSDEREVTSALNRYELDLRGRPRAFVAPGLGAWCRRSLRTRPRPIRHCGIAVGARVPWRS